MKLDMKGSTRRRRRNIKLFLVSFIVLSNHIIPSVGDGAQKREVKNREKPSLVKIITRVFGKSFPPSSWEIIKTAIYKIQLKFSPPNLDFRGGGEEKGKAENGRNGAGEKVKEAVKKSFGTGKETVEESAKMASGVVSEAVHITAEKVKKKASNTYNREESHDEI